MARLAGTSIHLDLEIGKAITLYTCPDGAGAALGGVRVVNVGSLTSKVPETPGAATTPGDTAFSVGVIRAASAGSGEGTHWLAGSEEDGEPIALGERPAPIGVGLMLSAGDAVVAIAFGYGLVAHISVTEASQ